MALNSSNVVFIGEPIVNRSGRQAPRFKFLRSVDWDFFTSATGSKPGFLENLSEGGCLLRTSDPIEHRRWVRLVIRGDEDNLFFTCVGRVIRSESKMEAWDERSVTLYRHGIEFVHPVNPVVLDKVRAAYPVCGDCGGVADSTQGCSACHLRRACHNLMDL